MEAAQRQYLQQFQQQPQGMPQWPAHPQPFPYPGAAQFAPPQTGWQQSFAPQQAGTQQAAPVAPPQPPPAQPPQPSSAHAPPTPTARESPQAPPDSAAQSAESAAKPESGPGSEKQELVTATLAGLAMRDLTLVESMIDIVENLEDSSEDPEILDKLFKIDNLATRMRRNSENLLVLAGQDSGDPSTESVPLLDVARAAISEISNYQRIQLGTLPDLFISGTSADDLSHLLAELMDNATEKSPDHAQVVISAQALADERLLITVEDEGIGIPPEQLASFNSRLRGEPVLDEDVMRHMGLYVVSRIAHRYGFEVQLERRAFRGVSAHVTVPAAHYDKTGPSQTAGSSEPAVPEPGSAARGQLAPSGQRSSTAPREQASGPEKSAPSPRPQENSSAMESSSDSPVTSAGLPRRSAHRNTAPVPMTSPDQPESTEGSTNDGSSDEQADGVTRAERIRADLEGFVEGQEEAARPDED
ncbi:sensor histidine kinase [Halostreptopolyspora alba]